MIRGIELKRISGSFIITVAACVILSGCSLDSIVKVDNPQIGDEVDLKYLDTREGALGLLHSTLGSLQRAVDFLSLEVGNITDELTARPYNSPENQYGSPGADTRVETSHAQGVRGLQLSAYNDLQTTRVTAGYSRHFLNRQADSSLNYAVSSTYAYEGYAITMLAENLCSGVPLSDVRYGEKVVYGKALSTDSLLATALSKFDSALSVRHDSSRFVTLATIGKARALMSLGRYADAAQVVAAVQPGDNFTITYTETVTPIPNSAIPQALNAFWTNSTPQPGRSSTVQQGHEIVNFEGGNGLMWFSDPKNIDPRLPVDVSIVDDTLYVFPGVVRQRKFAHGNVTFELASWIEAKMIEAEHLLSTDNPAWIDPLNEARRSVGLADLASPATQAQRVNLMFSERAFWFYLHGTRLSDMRRLVRQYGRSVNSVYPVGSYNRSSQVYTYGDATVFIPSVHEFVENQNYSGCINRTP